MTAVDLDESKGDHDSCQNVLPDPVTDGKPSTKTPSTFKPNTQPHPMNERPTPLVHHEHSLPKPHSQNVTAGPSKEPNNCQETHLHWILVRQR
ncbi:unnamed protein product [Colias eurytheme]|nr:unnamed protein product [Colias eurytheme]